MVMVTLTPPPATAHHQLQLLAGFGFGFGSSVFCEDDHYAIALATSDKVEVTKFTFLRSQYCTTSATSSSYIASFYPIPMLLLFQEVASSSSTSSGYKYMLQSAIL